MGRPRGQSRAGDFVGRERETELLTGLWSDAIEGRGGLVVVSGEAGIGKTSLLREVAAACEAKTPGSVAWASCREDGESPGFWPWIQLLDALTAEPDLEIEPAVAADLALLRGERDHGATSATEPAAAASARFRLKHSVLRLIDSAARRRPRLLVIDDLHRGDEPSLEILAFLAAHLPPLRVLIIGAYRTFDGSAEHPLAHSGVPAAAALRLPIGGLGPDHAAALAAAFLGADAADSMVAALVERTGGNPLFLQEIALLAAATGDERGGGSPESTGARLPTTVIEVMQRRVSALGEQAHRVLRMAAIGGRDIDPGLVATALGCARSDVSAALAQATELRLVEFGSRSRFSHSLVQEAIYQAMAPGERLDGHEAMAQALAAHPLDDRGLIDLAVHSEILVRAGRSAGFARWPLNAAEDAARRLAHADALRWAEIAVALAKERRDELGWVAEYDALSVMADALVCLGDLSAARRAFEDAASLAQPARDGARFARAALGVGRTVVGAGVVDAALVGLLEQACAMAPEELEPILVARLAIERYWHGDSLESRNLSADALKAADALKRETPAQHESADLALAAALHARLFTLRGPSDPAERLMIGERLIDHAVALGDDDLEFAGRTFAAPELLQVGDLIGYRREVAWLVERSTRTRLPLQQWYASLFSGCLAIFEGRVADSLASIDQAAEWAAVIGTRVNSVYRVGQLVPLLRDVGGLAELEEEIRVACDQFPYFATLRCDLALVLAESGRIDECTALLDHLLFDAAAGIPPDSLWLASLAVLSETAAVIGHREHLRVLYDLMAPFAGRVSIQGLPCSWGVVDRQLGIASLGLGDIERADWHLKQAHRQLNVCRARPLALRTLLDRSSLLAVRGAHEESRRMAGAVAIEAAELGLDRLAALARSEPAPALDDGSATHRSAAGPGSAAGPAVHGAGLSRREHDVMGLLVDGARNKEIAAQLHVSLNTVERHLSNIYTKLGVRNRAEAVAWAIRNGFT